MPLKNRMNAKCVKFSMKWLFVRSTVPAGMPFCMDAMLVPFARAFDRVLLAGASSGSATTGAPGRRPVSDGRVSGRAA